MSLPIRPPFPPMEALLVDEIPIGEDWQYEPRWCGAEEVQRCSWPHEA
jgi:hypothetical protein